MQRLLLLAAKRMENVRVPLMPKPTKVYDPNSKQRIQRKSPEKILSMHLLKHHAEIKQRLTAEGFKKTEDFQNGSTLFTKTTKLGHESHRFYPSGYIESAIIFNNPLIESLRQFQYQSRHNEDPNSIEIHFHKGVFNAKWAKMQEAIKKKYLMKIFKEENGITRGKIKGASISAKEKNGNLEGPVARIDASLVKGMWSHVNIDDRKHVESIIKLLFSNEPAREDTGKLGK